MLVFAMLSCFVIDVVVVDDFTMFCLTKR